MKRIFALDQVRARPELYLGSRTPSAAHLAAKLAAFARRCGANDVQVRAHRDDWTSVVADTDWVTTTLTRPDRGIQGAFTGFIPANLGTQNEVRYEPIVTAFSRSLAVVRSAEYVQVVGERPPAEVLAAVEGAAFAVVFQFDPAAQSR
jgi:hypothetical protein